MSSIPGLERSYVTQGNEAHVWQYWACDLQQEEPPQWDAHAPQLESNPCSPQLEKAHVWQQRPNSAKHKLKIFLLF